MDADIKARWQSDFQTGSVDSICDLLAQEPALASVPVDCTLESGSVRRWSPLFVASNHLQSLGKVRTLVEAGADLNDGTVGTHWPSESYDINKYLVEQIIDVNQPSYLGFHGLGIADMATFLLMLQNGLDPNATWPLIGETALHVQARSDDDAHLARAYCLITAGAKVNAQARSGLDDEPILNNEHFIRYGKETPLHFAARLGNINQVRLLLDHGADRSLRTVSQMIEPKKVEDWPGERTAPMWPMTTFERVLFEPCEGETPLEMAVREGYNEIAAVLRG